MYGIRFARRQRRKIDGSEDWVVPRPVLSVVVGGESSCGGTDLFVPRFLYSVLRYMRSSRLRLTQLLAFLCSEPMASVYASCGIQFLPVSSC